jgi:hypothetical protein
MRKRSGMLIAAALFTITSLFILNYVRSKMLAPIAEQSQHEQIQAD